MGSNHVKPFNWIQNAQQKSWWQKASRSEYFWTKTSISFDNKWLNSSTKKWGISHYFAVELCLRRVPFFFPNIWEKRILVWKRIKIRTSKKILIFNDSKKSFDFWKNTMNGKSVKYFNSNTKWSIGVFAKCKKNKKIKKRFKSNLNSADLIRILA